MEIRNSRALVTGAASGMGRCFAMELAREGASVVASDVNEDGLAELAAAAEGLEGRIVTVRADVSDEASVTAMFDAAWEALGGLEILINNAGIFRDGLLVKKDKETGEVRRFPLSRWQEVIDVDLTGPFLCTREFAARQVEHRIGRGVVVNISSVARHGNVGQSNYSAAKAGLVADTRLWALELARYGIRTGAVAPGFVETPILLGMRPDVLEKMLKAVPLRRAGKPEEVWQAVRFIITCDYFTGRCIDLDGGLSI